MGKRENITFTTPEYRFDYREGGPINNDTLEQAYEGYKVIVARLGAMDLFPSKELNGDPFTAFAQTVADSKTVTLRAEPYHQFFADLENKFTPLNLSNFSSFHLFHYHIINAHVMGLPLTYLSRLTPRLNRLGNGKFVLTRANDEVVHYENVEKLSVDEGLEMLELLIETVSREVLTKRGITPSPSKVIRYLAYQRFLSSGSSLLQNAGKRKNGDGLPAKVEERVDALVEKEVDMFASLYSLSHTANLSYHSTREFTMTLDVVEELGTMPREFIKELALNVLQ